MAVGRMTTHAESPAEDTGERDLLEEYFKDAELQGLDERTIQTYRSDLQYFINWLDVDPRAAGRDELREFLYHLRNDRTARDGSTGLKPSTLNIYFAAMNSFYQFLTYESEVQENPVPEIRDRYLDIGQDDSSSSRQLLSIKEMSTLVHGTLNPRDRAIIILFAKTGIRRNELIQIDLQDIDWKEQSIRLKPTPKRTNLVVFFDGEAARCLERWLRARESGEPDTDALFTNQFDGRLKRHGVYSAVTNNAENVGFHAPDSTDPQERFTPHCCRHWFTTHLRRSGMKREFIQELRGDTRGDSIDIYDHIDREELREAYLAHIPSLGI